MSKKAEQAAIKLGEHLATWRKLLNLTADQVAQRADINRGTLRRLEAGQVVGVDVLLEVSRSLGILDALINAADPWESDLGRARAGATLPKRVRHHD